MNQQLTQQTTKTALRKDRDILATFHCRMNSHQLHAVTPLNAASLHALIINPRV